MIYLLLYRKFILDIVKIENRFYTEYLPDDFSVVIERFENTEVETNQMDLIQRNITIHDLGGCVALQLSLT